MAICHVDDIDIKILSFLSTDDLSNYVTVDIRGCWLVQTIAKNLLFELYNLYDIPINCTVIQYYRHVINNYHCYRLSISNDVMGQQIYSNNVLNIKTFLNNFAATHGCSSFEEFKKKFDGTIGYIDLTIAVMLQKHNIDNELSNFISRIQLNTTPLTYEYLYGEEHHLDIDQTLEEFLIGRPKGIFNTEIYEVMYRNERKLISQKNINVFRKLQQQYNDILITKINMLTLMLS